MKFKTSGVCSRAIDFDVVDGKVVNVHFTGGCAGKVTGVKFFGGCPGNHLGIENLVEGMDIDEVIKRLRGLRCGMRESSCPDQLAKALKEYKKDNE